ncbi:hypothetical protein LIA77_03240 [Sarocladium implicatum]|nr:hypothetical protein LIA77_03240 [Sarocladium implicatum]
MAHSSIKATAAAAAPTKGHHQRESRKQKPTPFDPDDLCRRLQIVLAEERAYTERKRRSRANIDRATTDTQPAKAEKSRRGREVPIEISAYQATAEKSAQITAARRSVLSTSAEKRRSRGPASESNLPQPPDKDELPSYHHVPRVAATQFTRTTAHEPVSDGSLVHKLSRKAMKFHMENPSAQVDPRGGNIRPDEQARALQRVQGEREKVYGRNQFQHPAAILEVTGDLDEKQTRDVAYRQTFDTLHRGNQGAADGVDEAYNPRLSSSSARGLQRGGAGPRDSHDFPNALYPVLTQDSAEYGDIPIRIDDHRVDWTQSDEKSNSRNVLRKADPKWKLRNRLSFHRGSKTEKDMLNGSDRAASPALRSHRSSFFDRFRRQQVA